MRSAAFLIAALTAAPAAAATFTSEAHDHTVVVYSSSKVPEHCELSQPFSIMSEGQRQTTAITCHVDIEPGNHREICKITHDQVVDPKLEGPVQVKECGPPLKSKK
ncbi:MAG: hypothetical protein ACXWN9_08110 [Candidatus Binataceae bacterium]